jgi:hypothetical protein
MMDYIELAEKKLKEYRLLERSIDNMTAEIHRLKMAGAPKPISAISYDNFGIRGSNKQNEAINIACAIADYQEIRLLNQKEIKRINANLNFISRELGKEDYGELLRLWYMGLREQDPDTGFIEYKKISVEEICERLQYSAGSRRYFYERKDDALGKFAKAYYGVRT